jgi:hypothetical protein
MMEAAVCSETLVVTYKSTRCYNSEKHSLNFCCHEKFKSAPVYYDLLDSDAG